MLETTSNVNFATARQACLPELYCKLLTFVNNPFQDHFQPALLQTAAKIFRDLSIQ